MVTYRQATGVFFSDMTEENYLNLVGKSIWPQLLFSLLLISMPAGGCYFAHLTTVEVNISTVHLLTPQIKLLPIQRRGMPINVYWLIHPTKWLKFSLSSGLKNETFLNSQILLTHQPYSALTTPLEAFVGLQFFFHSLTHSHKWLQILKFHLNKYNVYPTF